MAELTLDCLGEACPVPLIKTQTVMKDMSISDMLTVNIDHSCAMKNITYWARAAGHTVEINEVDEGVWDVIIKKLK